ncbi:Outer membrane lipoprotein-sorting protein [Geosporobacter subterraneus DSM 17957]|uniref:Outer membrane lipoprotein-sorting protein n=1 Tax=Geosporobacter subterraneus DSM 17957 TaxID=1121919 RepID=A0A1M6D7J1_9FIRM|nr:outer-membrane lipoprotein carrier protein LolA [Geosporobacter subterraneus]SHI69192.1 Outer membrane lipoprotein-sorting protein [Geosporobacter subterraneus DSM 17957]
MRSYKVMLLFLILLALTISGCAPKSDEQIYYESQRLLNKIESYFCEAQITVIGNKDPQHYKMRQWFRKPDQYRLEVLEPEELKGNITLSDGKRAWIYHPGIEETWVMEDFRNSEKQNMFLGYFIKNTLETEQVTLNREKINNKVYLVIDTMIPGNHVYFHMEKLWFDIETMEPHRLQVLDSEHRVRIDVRYENFEYNPKLEDNLFRISGSSSS